ncbi:MAG: HNH endonuclease [Planctomycetes bacterium]|nr:HNH endonuclease [Planctomycetota bacterium]
MRPVLRGDRPQTGDFANYRDAFGELVSRIGMFCSYCERRVATQLAVEHIQPKDGPYGHPDMERRWENFLLGCVNCNSTKGAKDVVLANLLLPDRDNTGAAYEYTMDGKIKLATGLTASQSTLAMNTLKLVGLDKPLNHVLDSNGQLVAIDRMSQRMEVWLIARASKDDLQANPNDAFRRQIARAATGHGFFSIWMTVFQDDSAVRKLLIKEFKGTAVDCFDPNTTHTISPRPANGLADGSKL